MPVQEIGEKTITLGRIGVAYWKWNCPEGQSVLQNLKKNDKDEPSFSFTLTVGDIPDDASQHSILTALLSPATWIAGELLNAVVEGMPKLTNLSGTVSISATAVPYFERCKEDNKQQVVGYDYKIDLGIDGKLTVTAGKRTITTNINMLVPIIQAGERVPCKCNHGMAENKQLGMLDSHRSPGFEVAAVNVDLNSELNVRTRKTQTLTDASVESEAMA